MSNKPFDRVRWTIVVTFALARIRWTRGRRGFIITTIAAYRLCAHTRVYVNDVVSIAQRKTHKYFIMLRVRRRIHSLPKQKRVFTGNFQKKKTVPPPWRYRCGYLLETNRNRNHTPRTEMIVITRFPRIASNRSPPGDRSFRFGRANVPNAIRVDLVRHFKIVLSRYEKTIPNPRSNPYRRNETVNGRRPVPQLGVVFGPSDVDNLYAPYSARTEVLRGSEQKQCIQLLSSYELAVFWRLSDDLFFLFHISHFLSALHVSRKILVTVICCLYDILTF